MTDIHSRAYVDTMIRFFDDRRFSHQYQLWSLFRERGQAFGVETLDAELSLQMATQYECRLRSCFRNAAAVAMAEPKEFLYVEGIATSVIPMEHAWLLHRRTGRIVDPTWIMLAPTLEPDDVKDYFGVPLPHFRRYRRHLQQSIAILWRYLHDELKRGQT